MRQKQIAAVELTKAVSEDGLKLLKAEHRELETFLGSVETLRNTVRNLWKLEPWAKNRDLAAVADYIEKVQELKNEITAILAGAGEPARDKKGKN